MRVGKGKKGVGFELTNKKTGVKDFGQAMKAVMKELRGKADAKTVGDLVKKKLGLDG